MISRQCIGIRHGVNMISYYAHVRQRCLKVPARLRGTKFSSDRRKEKKKPLEGASQVVQEPSHPCQNHKTQLSTRTAGTTTCACGRTTSSRLRRTPRRKEKWQRLSCSYWRTFAKCTSPRNRQARTSLKTSQKLNRAFGYALDRSRKCVTGITADKATHTDRGVAHAGT